MKKPNTASVSPSNNKIFNLISEHRWLLVIIAVHSLAWLYLNQHLNPHSDFIDHWMQSRVWSLSYYEHPPMVAVLIRFLTGIFGNSELGLEISALVYSNFINICMYVMALVLFDKRAALFSVLLMEASPFFFAKAASIQTEQPLILFWILSLLALMKYLKTGKNYWLLVLGVFTGLGALSKYTMILFYISGAVYITLEPERRKEWKNPWQIAGGLVSLAVFSPVIIWNAQNGWLSFRFQLAKGSVDEGMFLGRSSLLFLIGVIAAFSLIIMPWGYARLIRYIKSSGFKNPEKSLQKSYNNVLVVFSVVPILFFTVALMRNEYHDPHWAVIAIIPFYIWLAGQSSALWEKGKKRFVGTMYASSLVLNVAVFVLIFSLAFMPHLKIPYFRQNLADQVFGWDRSVKKVERLLTSEGYGDIKYVISPLYFLASQFSLYLPSQPTSYSLTRTLRNIWSDPNDMTSENTIAVCMSACRNLHKRIGKTVGFKLEPIGVVKIEVTETIRTIEVYRVLGRDYSLLEPDYIDFDYRLKPGLEEYQAKQK